MLDAFIIEELKRRKEERLRRDLNRPVAELPAPDEIPPEPKEEPADGVVIIDYNS